MAFIGQGELLHALKIKETLSYYTIVLYTIFFHTMGPDPPSLFMLIAKAKVRIPLSKITEWSSVNTMVRLPHWATLYSPGLVTKKIHMKGYLTSKNCQPSAPSSQASKRETEPVQLLLVQDCSPCYLKEPKTLIQTVVAVQSYTEITCKATVAWKQTSYLAENYIYSRCKDSFFFSGQNMYKNIGNWLGFCQNNMQEVYFVSWVPRLFFFLIETSEEIVIRLEITLRYSSKEFLVTIVFYISESDIKQQLDRAAHKPGKFLPGVLHRYRIPAQSLNCWKSGGDYMNYLLLVCVQVSSLVIRVIRNITGSGKQRQTNPAGWVQSNLPWQNSSSPVQTLQQLVQCWLSLPAEFRFPTYGGHKRAQISCTNCVREK